MKNRGLRKSLSFLVVTLVLLCTPIIASADAVPWTSESYRAYAYAYASLWGKYQSSDKEEIGPPLPITASAASNFVINPYNPIYFGGASVTEITNSSMYTSIGVGNSCGDACEAGESEVENEADASFTGTFIADAPVLLYSFNYTRDQPPYNTSSFLVVHIDDLTTSTILFSNEYTTDYSANLSIPIQYGHEIRVKFEIKTKGIYDYIYNSLPYDIAQSLTYSTALAPEPTISIDIDIQPGIYPNRINLKSKDVIPVAILANEDFDATLVNPSTVVFGPNEARVHGKHRIKDVDKDGHLDLVLYFKIQETGFACGDTEAELSGETFDGQVIEGADSIHVVNCKRRHNQSLDMNADHRTLLLSD